MDRDRMTSDVSRNFVRCTSLSKGDVITKTVVPAFSISHWAILGSDVGSDDEDGLKGATPAFDPHNLQLSTRRLPRQVFRRHLPRPRPLRLRLLTCCEPAQWCLRR